MSPHHKHKHPPSHKSESSSKHHQSECPHESLELIESSSSSSHDCESSSSSSSSHDCESSSSSSSSHDCESSSSSSSSSKHKKCRCKKHKKKWELVKRYNENCVEVSVFRYQ